MLNRELQNAKDYIQKLEVIPVEKTVIIEHRLN